jgi:hypothetical protein
MAPHIVSWSDREICISPVISSAASVISFDSTFSDPIPNHSQMSPTASEALGLPSDQFGPKYSSLPGLSEEGRIPRGGHPTLDDSFVRHDAYYFKDGNVTFLVCGLPAFAYPMCRADQGADRWYAVLRPSVLLFSRFHLLLNAICPARHT